MDTSGSSVLPNEIDFEGHAFPARGVGPGDRLIVWVRGCAHACVGCMAPELWEPGAATPITLVAETIVDELRGADGLTVSGGEPFDQAAAVAALLDVLHAALPDLEVVVYTGYVLEELLVMGSEAESLLARIDILIDGPFVVDESNTLLWRGSDNQRVHLLSERSGRYFAEAQEEWTESRPIGIQMLGSDRLKIVGIPRRGDVERYRDIVSASGMEVRKAT